MDTEFNRSMNGGKKRKWLKENRERVVWVSEQVGEDECCRIFNMKRSTLERMHVDTITSSDVRWTKSDRALLTAKIAEAGVADLKDELAELKPMKDYFENVIKPQLKAAHEYYEKLTAPDKERQEALKVPSEEECRQLTHRGDANICYVTYISHEAYFTLKTGLLHPPPTDFPNFVK